MVSAPSCKARKIIEQRHVASGSRSGLNPTARKEFKVLENRKELLLADAANILFFNRSKRASDSPPGVANMLLTAVAVGVLIYFVSQMCREISAAKSLMSFLIVPIAHPTR
jgi:hypothetical protein